MAAMETYEKTLELRDRARHLMYLRLVAVKLLKEIEDEELITASLLAPGQRAVFWYTPGFGLAVSCDKHGSVVLEDCDSVE